MPDGVRDHMMVLMVAVEKMMYPVHLVVVDVDDDDVCCGCGCC